MEKKEIKRSVFSLGHFFIFFVLAAFTVSCNLILFFSHINLPYEVVRGRALITFVNVIILSVLFTLVDVLRRKYTVEKPVKRIVEGTRRFTKGDFKTKITPLNYGSGKNEFDIIIEGLNCMADELSGIETLRTDFVANVSHELKTPLSIISNYATLMQDKDLQEDKRIEYADTLIIATQRLSALITNILKLNKLENQIIHPESEMYNISEQLCESLLGFEELLDQKNIDIQTEIEDDVNFEAPKELLSLIWNNLISNAIKFTKPGGRISISLDRQEDMIVVKISDTGCGISKEAGKHIFDKFYQADTSRSSQGNGLGLALVKRVIDILGYDIRVDSEIGKGSTFTVYLKGD